VQVNTGTGCHLEADMLERALKLLQPARSSLVVVENVGNLVCPALFDLGEKARVVIFSVTEGEDKPLKYPHMFSTADVLLLSRIDLLPHLRVNLQLMPANALQVNPRLKIFPVSAYTGKGLEARYGWLLRADSPAMVAGVGGLFALSFDTVGQAALFALTASQFGGRQPALLLALLFIAGMLATDGLNGWWISGLIRRSDATSRVASRVMALAVSGVSLLTAGLGVATQTMPSIDTWTEGKARWFGTAIVAVIFGSSLLGQRLAVGGGGERARHSAT
jgi:CobW/HypB/UreG, nucleotide-binding domain